MGSLGLAAMFPGQGSQQPGMGKALTEAHASASEVFDRVSEATGKDMRAVCWEADAETLRQTENAQLALFTASLAAYLAAAEASAFTPLVGAGHSVGEYAALAASGMLDVEDAARLVQRRGDLMARAGRLAPGTMAAVLGLDDEAVERVCAEVSSDDAPVVAANYNSPGQVVISGAVAAVESACERLKEAGAKRCLPLNVSGAFHSPLMRDAAEAMGEALRRVDFRAGTFPVISNVLAEPVEDPDAWPELLTRQLAEPVRWAASVRKMAEMGAALFAEFGVGTVLCGLVRRTSDAVEALPVESPETLAQFSDRLVGVGT
jgi:[acyl-carrier-protein] S-malonyltransferase